MANLVGGLYPGLYALGGKIEPPLVFAPGDEVTSCIVTCRSLVRSDSCLTVETPVTAMVQCRSVATSRCLVRS